MTATCPARRPDHEADDSRTLARSPDVRRSVCDCAPVCLRIAGRPGRDDGLRGSSPEPRWLPALLSQRERQNDVFRRLFELLVDRGAYCLGQFMQGFRFIDAGKGDRYRHQPSVVPIESDLRFDPRRCFEIAFNRPRVTEALRDRVDGIAGTQSKRENENCGHSEHRRPSRCNHSQATNP